MRELDKDALFRRVAEKEGVHPSDVEAIYKAQMDLVAETMKEGHFEAVRLPHLGLFHVKPGRIRHLKKKHNP